MTSDLLSVMARLHLYDPIGISRSWFSHMRKPNGRVHLPAVLILAEIINLFKPVHIGEVKLDQVVLQDGRWKTSYRYFEDMLGLTTSQAREGLEFLDSMGLVKKEIEPLVETDQGNQANVMYLVPVADAIASITTIVLRCPRRAASDEGYKGGYIYLIKAETGEYKIGYSVRPQDRLDAFAVQPPFEYELIHTFRADDMPRAESLLHHLFDRQRIRGEWFDLNQEEVAAICHITAFEDDAFLLSANGGSTTFSILQEVI